MYPGIVQQENLANTEEQLSRLLFGKGQEGVWFDPSDLSTMFQDVDGTIPVTADGDPVKLILDKSGNGNHYVYTDGSDNLYRTDGTLHWIETPTSYRYQFVVPAFTERASCFGAVSGTSARYMSFASNNAATDRYIMVADSVLAGSPNHAVYSQTGINRVNGSEFTGTRSDMYDVYNTGQKYVVGATGLDLNNIAGGVLKIGLQYATQSFDGGTWHGFIIWEGNDSIPIIEKVEQYLADKAGITLP